MKYFLNKYLACPNFNPYIDSIRITADKFLYICFTNIIVDE